MGTFVGFIFVTFYCVSIRKVDITNGAQNPILLDNVDVESSHVSKKHDFTGKLSFTKVALQDKFSGFDFFFF
jgi:hypothetical protein